MRRTLRAFVLPLFMALSLSACGTATTLPAQGTAKASDPLAHRTERPDKAVAAALIAAALPTASVKGFVPASISFWSGLDGIAGGTTGPLLHPQGAIALTHDGGESWQIAYRGGTDVPQVDAFGAHDALATLIQKGGSSTLLTTQDGGARFTPLVGSAGLSGAVSVSDGAVWALSDTKRTPQLVHSDAGTGPWTPLPSPCLAPALQLTAVSLSAPGIGYALCTGAGGTGRMGKAVFMTEDGGSRWSPVVTVAFGGPPTGGLSAFGYPMGIAFLPSGNGWLWEGRGSLLASRDGGHTWQDSGLGSTIGPTVVAASFLTPAAGFALLQGAGGVTLEETQDGGMFWANVKTWTPAAP